MNKPNLKQLAKNAQKAMVKHSPEILTGLGIAGMITTTVLAVKATPKAVQLIEERKEEEHIDELPVVDTVKTTWKCYLPAAVIGGVSIACLIGATSVNSRRTAALATAYKLSETALSELHESVRETVGEKKEQLIMDKVAEKQLEKNPVTNNNVIITDKGNCLCLESISGRYFRSDIDAVKRAETEVNRKLLDDMFVGLSEYYDMLNLEHTEISSDLGWSVDEGYVRFHYSSKLTQDGTPCLVVQYDRMPKYDYWKVS